MKEDIHIDIEKRLATLDPAIELVQVITLGSGKLRVVIDHPSGVTLSLCERVTKELGDIREEYALEVSSPGLRRPLTKPEHFQRFTGSRVKVKVLTPIDGVRKFIGELLAASDQDISLMTEEGLVSITCDNITKANLIAE